MPPVVEFAGVAKLLDMAETGIAITGRTKHRIGHLIKKMTGLPPQLDDGRNGHIGWNRQVPGYWRTLDQGFLRYGSGKLLTKWASGDNTVDAILLTMDGTWGLKLFEYEDAMGVNDQGEGSVVQPWVVGFAPGKFSWVVID